MEKRLENKYRQSLKELEYSVCLAVYKYLKNNASLEDKYITLGPGQVRIYIDDGNVYVTSKQANYIYEGTGRMRDLPIERQLDILKEVEDFLEIK